MTFILYILQEFRIFGKEHFINPMAIHVNHSYLDWQPVKHTIFRDDALATTMHEKGYEVLQWLDRAALDRLNAIFASEHTFDIDGGGMFYTMYSRDLAYRKRVHDAISEVLNPMLEAHFKDYKNVVNAFVVKMPGEKSEFYLHQDTTGLDEFRFSPLSLWIPLDDVTEEDGALAVIEKTHWFFSPYRGVSFPFPFREIHSTLRNYLQPVPMKAGEVLCFDNRIVHNSLANQSEKLRVAVICGLFPKAAEFQNCYSANEQSPIEVFEHNDQYLLENLHFFYNCTDRPKSGKVVARVSEKFPMMTSEEFEMLCAENGIPRVNKVRFTSSTTVDCQLIAEPDGINRFEGLESPVRTVQKRSIFHRLFRS